MKKDCILFRFNTSNQNPLDILVKNLSESTNTMW